MLNTDNERHHNEVCAAELLLCLLIWTLCVLVMTDWSNLLKVVTGTFDFQAPVLTFLSLPAVSAQALCSVGHLDSKHNVSVISDNNMPGLNKIIPRSTNKSLYCLNVHSGTSLRLSELFMPHTHAADIHLNYTNWVAAVCLFWCLLVLICAFSFLFTNKSAVVQCLPVYWSRLKLGDKNSADNDQSLLKRTKKKNTTKLMTVLLALSLQL